MTKPKNKPMPKMVQKWVAKIAMPAKKSSQREATHFIESRISYREDNTLQDFLSLSSK
jgi:hypothetical protein